MTTWQLWYPPRRPPVQSGMKQRLFLRRKWPVSEGALCRPIRGLLMPGNATCSGHAAPFLWQATEEEGGVTRQLIICIWAWLLSVRERRADKQRGAEWDLIWIDLICRNNRSRKRGRILYWEQSEDKTDGRKKKLKWSWVSDWVSCYSGAGMSPQTVRCHSLNTWSPLTLSRPSPHSLLWLITLHSG